MFCRSCGNARIERSAGARLATEWRACGEPGEVTRLLRQLQSIRIGQVRLGPALPVLTQFTEVPAPLNALLEKLHLLRLFATPPDWALTQAA